MTDSTAPDQARLREEAERIVWPKGRTGDADEMGYHIRNLDILFQRVLAALAAAEARVREECASLAEEGCFDILCTAPGGGNRCQAHQGRNRAKHPRHQQERDEMSRRSFIEENTPEAMWRDFLKANRWEADTIITNHFGDIVWLQKCDGGITDCCLANEPCDYHRAIRVSASLRGKSQELESTIEKEI